MFTGTDVLIIVLMTIFFTAIVTAVVFSCAIINGTEKEKERAYKIGYEKGVSSCGYPTPNYPISIEEQVEHMEVRKND